jgi:hypothetical protein
VRTARGVLFGGPAGTEGVVKSVKGGIAASRCLCLASATDDERDCVANAEARASRIQERPAHHIKMKRGIEIICNICRRQKAPRGRSASPLIPYCLPPFLGPEFGEPSCHGYYDEPQVGDLWPNETEEEFGFPVSEAGTEEIETPTL